MRFCLQFYIYDFSLASFDLDLCSALKLTAYQCTYTVGWRVIRKSGVCAALATFDTVITCWFIVLGFDLLSVHVKFRLHISGLNVVMHCNLPSPFTYVTAVIIVITAPILHHFSRFHSRLKTIICSTNPSHHRVVPAHRTDFTHSMIVLRLYIVRRFVF